MGKKGPLAWVAPAEFKERTSLRLSSRSASTQAVDRAYEKYYYSQRTEDRDRLYFALQEYVKAHGGYWSNCERNKVSGGLLEFVYNASLPTDRQFRRLPAAELDRRAAADIANVQIPHARYGVLYFLANIDLQMDVTSSVIDGVSAVGGTIGVAATTDYSALSSASGAARHAFSMSGQDVSGHAATRAGRGVLQVGRMAAATGGTVSTVPPPPPVSALPTTEAAFTRMGHAVSGTFDLVKYLGPNVSSLSGVAKGALVGVAALPTIGLGVATGAVVTAGALAVDGAAALARAARSLWDKLSGAFGAIGRFLSGLWRSKRNAAFAQYLGMIIKTGTKIAMDMVMRNAVPFLGGAIDLGTGLVRTLDAANDRLRSYFARRDIRVREGHPKLMADSIEHQMSMGIFRGLGDALKGAGKLATSMFLPGLGSLVNVVMAVIEWLVKLVYRLMERFAIQSFLAEARAKFKVVQAQAKPVTAPGVPQRLEPDLTVAGSILTDSEQFTAFFQSGCDASPLVPMLVLNSGLAGSLMTLVELFEPNGRQSSRGQGGPDELMKASDYFARLKRFGAQYLRSSGFQFVPVDHTNKSIAGYLLHATGTPMPKQYMMNASGERITVARERQSHVDAVGWGNRALAFAKG